MRGLQGCGARHRSRIEAQRVPDLDAEDVPEQERDPQTGEAGDQRQQIVLLPGADHALEELPAIQNADPVEEHDQAGQADRPDDLGLRCERADREADEKHRADTQREAEDVDLTDQISHSDGQEGGQDRLASDDVARSVQHCMISPHRTSRIQRTLQPACLKLSDNPLDQICGSVSGYPHACSRGRWPST